MADVSSRSFERQGRWYLYTPLWQQHIGGFTIGNPRYPGHDHSQCLRELRVQRLIIGRCAGKEKPTPAKWVSLAAVVTVRQGVGTTEMTAGAHARDRQFNLTR